MERYGHLGGNYDPDEVTNASYNSLNSFFPSSHPNQTEVENKENSLQDSNKFSIEFTSKQSKTKKIVQVHNPTSFLFTQ
jgi:hypothetical protein